MNAAGDPQVDETVQTLWNRHTDWSAAADRLKTRRERWRIIVLVLTVAGAALQTLAAVIRAPEHLIPGLTATVALTLVPFFTGYFLTADQTRRWLRSRSISEGIKSEIYTFRAFADPYRGEVPASVLLAKVKEINGFGDDMMIEVATIAPREAKPAPGQLNAPMYIRDRVEQQITQYYRPNGHKNARLAEIFRFAQIALGALAAVLSAIATYLQAAGVVVPVGPWVAVLTTVAGSVAAYAAASRYDFQATTYFATARQLEDLVTEWRQAGKSTPSDEWSAFVRSCEEVISAENRSWMAKLDRS